MALILSQTRINKNIILSCNDVYILFFFYYVIYCDVIACNATSIVTSVAN